MPPSDRQSKLDRPGNEPAGLCALLALRGGAVSASWLPEPVYQADGARVYAFERASEAVSDADRVVRTSPGSFAALWVGEFGPQPHGPDEMHRRVVDCLSYGEPGQLLLTLAAAETIREHLPSSIRFQELGNRTVLGGAVERLFICQLMPRSNEMDLAIPPKPPRLDFLGRTQELAEIEDRLHRFRLITITGPVGIGKSSLLLRALAEWETRETVWYLNVADLATAALLLPTLTDLLDIRKGPGQTHLEALYQNVPYREGVLAIDCSARDLPEVRSLVRTLIGIAPNIALVVSAPRPLKVSGESVLALKGLQIPHGPEPWQVLREYDSMALLEHRTKAFVESFRIDAQNAEPLAKICRILDGNPAAIELAAQKHRVLATVQIVHRLDRPLDFLRSRTNSNGRFDSLQRMVELTIEPLSGPAKALIARLATLESAVDFEDAAAMFPHHAQIHAFEELVDVGLLQRASDDYHSRRFVLALGVRQFCFNFLSSEERELAASCRIEFFEQVGLEARTGLSGAKVSEWMRRIEEQAADIIATIKGLLGRNEPERATTLLCNLLPFWHARNFPSPAYALAKSIMATTKRNPARARLENFAAQMAVDLGDTEGAEQHALRALKFAILDRQPRFEAFALATLASIKHDQLEWSPAATYLERAIAIQRTFPEPAAEYASLTGLVGVYANLGRCADAAARADEAYGMESHSVSPIVRAYLRNNHALALSRDGKTASALERLRESLELLDGTGFWLGIARSLRTLAETLSQLGRYEDAATLLGISGQILQMEESASYLQPESSTALAANRIIQQTSRAVYERQYQMGQMVPREELINMAMSMIST